MTRTPSRRTSPRQVAMTAALFLTLGQACTFECKAQTAPGEPKAKTLAAKKVEKPIPSTDASNSAIEQVRVIRREQLTEVRVEGKGQLSCTPFRLSHPDRLVLDFSRATLRVQPPVIPSGAQPVRAIRVSQFKADVARVVIDLDGQAPFLLTAKENIVAVIFGSSAAAMSAVAAEDEKEPSIVSAPALSAPVPSPSLDQAQSKIEGKSSPRQFAPGTPAFVSPATKDEKKSVVVGAFASATPTTPPSSAQAQSKISTPSPAGLQPTREQTHSSVAPGSSQPQSSESSSARSMSFPQHNAGNPVTAAKDEKKSSAISAPAPPKPAPSPSVDAALSKIEETLVGLSVQPAPVPASSPAKKAEPSPSSSSSSSAEALPTRTGNLASEPPSSTLPQPSNPSTISTSVAQNDAYVLRPLDVIAINIWRDPELSRIELVRPDGKISLPLVGDMQASGLTPKMLQIQINKALEDYVRNQEVTVILQEANSHRFNLLGAVARPGSYLLAANMTVLDALAAAGGLRDFAKVEKIYVLRKMPNGSPQRIPFNYKKAIRGSRDMNLQLLPGDTIVVP